MRAASGHLTERDRELVRMVGKHRVLTTGQLAALAFGNIITARHRLTLLVKIGVLRRFRPRRDLGSAPWHYLLGPVGAALLGRGGPGREAVGTAGARRPAAPPGTLPAAGPHVGVNWSLVHHDFRGHRYGARCWDSAGAGGRSELVARNGQKNTTAPGFCGGTDWQQGDAPQSAG